MAKKTWQLFPYEPRPNQKIIMEHICNILEKKSHLIAESGTGSGKTICSIAPSVEYSLKHKKKVLYLTRTNSQQKQVIIELRKIQDKKKIFGIGMQGRKNMCPLLDDRPDLEKGSAEELSKICGDLKKASIDGGKGCKYYSNLLNHDIDDVRALAKRDIPAVEEFVGLCKEYGDVCPYEANKLLLKEAIVITAPYIYFFSPIIRRALLDWMNVHISDLIVIVDEAHNLSDYARELYSRELTVRALELAALESQDIGNPQLTTDLDLSGACNMMQNLIQSTASEYVIDDDGLVPPTEIREQLMSRLKGTSREVQVMIMNMVTHGDIVRETKRKKGKLPRSHIFKTATFLQDWVMLEESEYAKLVSAGDNPQLEAYCLNPAKATGILNDCHSSIHLSGTINPIMEYRDSIGLPQDTDCLSLPSPFDKKNRLVIFTDDMTTKYDTLAQDEEMIPNMKKLICEIFDKYHRNTIIFFPSFSLLARFSDIAAETKRDVYFEEQGMSQEELMSTVKNFKLKEGAIMFAVMGGRISEGIDFPDRELEIAILVGIPFPKPTAKHRSLLNYYDRKFGKGWEYTVKAPTVRKMMQSIGRLLRRESDRGVALILDSRITQFKNEIPEASITEKPIEDIELFFN
ncbi:MAG: ATP-dependent DNA helicase [Thermoplasmata archaeon]|nr:ATP-dependent DNA helicase [Thermoplasmata archaeon]MCK5396883.1 ATP-dependent DNA helicase [Thermoplasmata archaeon]